MSYEEDKRLHHDIEFLGLRAHATAVGFLQLCRELRLAGLLDEAAISRIKRAIAKEIALTRPRSLPRDEFERNMRRRLDLLFTGREEIGGTASLKADLKSNEQ